MNNLLLKQAQRDDFPALAALIAQLNQRPETQCIHSGQGSESIHKQLLEYAAIDEIRLVLARQDERLIGAFGCEYDEQLGRGWLWGPFDPERRGKAFLAALLEALLAVLPSGIKRLDAFLNVANKDGLHFFLQHGFRQTDVAHVYTAQPFDEPLPIPKPCTQHAAAQTASIIVLHKNSFPEAYETGQSMIDKIDPDHQLFVFGNEEKVQGYLYATVDNSSGEGYIDFVAVQPEMRGQGIGKSLLLTALQWLFEEKKMPRVSLTVRDTLANARSLYEAVGFRLRYTGVAFRKDLD